ncbi:hypothetical protein [uncultured Varibaculum sp.]|uniref:hypothetical protein n=1 Tax=uncultured Varibaculum sp. TaxID=413896 RepID=UPI002804FD6C|nr:hypothetical protein [uncultured Varibaculum sp.]
MSILRKISSFAAATLVAAAPLCIGVCSAPLAQAAPSDTPATSTSTTNPAGQTQDLTDWAQKNCPGGKQFDNDTASNTPIYLGYANGETYLGYTEAKKATPEGVEKNFVDPRPDDPNDPNDPDAKYKKEIGTCVRVAAEETGQATANVYYGALFKADKSSLSASGFSKNTETVFQVTKKSTAWEPGTKIESRASESSDSYQEMPYSVANNSSDSGFNNLLIGTEDWINLRFSQSGFYTIYLKAITTDPQNAGKSYQAEMAYTFIVGKEARVPEDLQDIVDGKDGEGSDNPPTPDPGETTPDTPDPEPGDEGGGTHPGTDPTPNPGKTTPGTSTPGHGDQGGTSNPGTSPTSKPANGHNGAERNPNLSSSSRLQASSQLVGTNLSRTGGSLNRTRLAQPPANAFPTLPDPAAGSSPAENPAGDNPSSAADKDSNSDSQAASGNPLKFQADSTSTDLASKQWIRSSSLAVFALGLGAAGITGIGLLIFSRLHP